MANRTVRGSQRPGRIRPEQLAAGRFGVPRRVPIRGLTSSPQRPDCVAGHVGLELSNVEANYPFERSNRFAGIQPNSAFGDYSRLSCGVGDTQLARISAGMLARGRPAELARSRIPAMETSRV